MGRQSLDFLDRQDGKESDATQRIHRVQHSHGIILRLQKCGGKGKALIATRRRAILHVKIAAQVAASQYLFSKEKHGPWQDCADRFRYPKWQARPSFRFNRADRPRYGWRWNRQSVAGTPARAGAASGLQAEAQDDLLTQHRPTRPFLARAASGNHPGLEAGGARPRDRYCHRAGRKAPYCARYRAGDARGRRANNLWPSTAWTWSSEAAQPASIWELKPAWPGVLLFFTRSAKVWQASISPPSTVFSTEPLIIF